MPGIKVRDGEPIDKVLRIFKKQVEKAGVIGDLKKGQNSGSAKFAGFLRHMNGVQCVVRARSRNHRNSHYPNNGLEQTQALRIGQYRRFTCRASNNESVIAIVLQPFGQATSAIQIQ